MSVFQAFHKVIAHFIHSKPSINGRLTIQQNTSISQSKETTIETEYGRQKLGSMPTPFSDSLIPIDRLPRALKINCRPASIRLSFNQPSLLSRISLPASVSSHSSFLSHEDVTCQDD